MTLDLLIVVGAVLVVYLAPFALVAFVVFALWWDARSR